MYGVPKDKDNIVLVYNKEMFDAAIPSRWATSQIWKVRWVLPSDAPHPVIDSSSVNASRSAGHQLG